MKISPPLADWFLIMELACQYKLTDCLNSFRERNILDQVNSIAPKFQEGVKAFADSPIIGEVC